MGSGQSGWSGREGSERNTAQRQIYATPYPSEYRIVSYGSLVSSLQQSRGEGGEERMRSRIEQLERNIIFLQQQHTETLRQLHSQTEQLKRENRGNECTPHTVMSNTAHSQSQS